MGKLDGELAVDSVPKNIDIHPTTPWIAVGYKDKIPRIVDIETGVAVITLPAHDGVVEAVGFSADGNYIATGGTDHIVKIFEAGKSKEGYNAGLRPRKTISYQKRDIVLRSETMLAHG
jgi:WD40 repeat protein